MWFRIIGIYALREVRVEEDLPAVVPYRVELWVCLQNFRGELVGRWGIVV